MTQDFLVRRLGSQSYEPVWQQMQEFTSSREPTTPDEFWTLQHSPVFTLGLSKQQPIILGYDEIPVVKTDRGGLITYHGPGQIIGYFLWDIRRLGLDVHAFVRLVEQCMIKTLEHWGIKAQRWSGNPGVYVQEQKIGSLGVRIRRGCTYHGLSLNVKMDKGPFGAIDPCGIQGLRVTQVSDFEPEIALELVEDELIKETRKLHHECLEFVGRKVSEEVRS